MDSYWADLSLPLLLHDEHVSLQRKLDLYFSFIVLKWSQVCVFLKVMFARYIFFWQNKYNTILDKKHEILKAHWGPVYISVIFDIHMTVRKIEMHTCPLVNIDVWTPRNRFFFCSLYMFNWVYIDLMQDSS